MEFIDGLLSAQQFIFYSKLSVSSAEIGLDHNFVFWPENLNLISIDDFTYLLRKKQMVSTPSTTKIIPVVKNCFIEQAINQSM